MNLSRDGAMELAGHEGIVLSRYKDSVGVWTLGIGHTRGAGAPDPETFLGELAIADAFTLFEKDAKKYVDAVNAAVRVPVTQTQFDALVSFHFNTGAIGRASLVQKLNAGDIAGAAEGFMAWNKPPEVIGRRTKERDLFKSGKYANNGMATAYPADAAGRVLWAKPKRVDLRTIIASANAQEPKATLPAPKPPTAPMPVPAPAKGFWANLFDRIFPNPKGA